MKAKQVNVLEKLKNPLKLIELSCKGISKSAVDLVAQKVRFSDRKWLVF